MEIKHFRLIKTIAEEGSIANSSEKLFLTQSALSHQLRELEERLGFKVFHRTRNQWDLTEEGAGLYQLASEVLSRIDEGFKNIRNIHEGSQGLVRISAECYSFYSGLPAFIQKMAMLYPGIEVQLAEDATVQPISKLLSADIDMAIVSSVHSNQLNSRLLCTEEIYAVMHKEHVLAEKTFLEADDFSNQHLIIHSFPLETVFVYQHFLKIPGVMPIKISAVPMTEVMLEMVHANMGITCMSRETFEAQGTHTELLMRKIGPNGLFRSRYLISRKADETKKYINDFVAMIQEEYERV